MDELARVIHEDYLNKVKKIDSNKPSHKDWESLPVDFKNQNREQADHMYIKIRASQCKNVSVSENDLTEFDFLKNFELVELLAEMEYNRWWAHMA